MIRWPYFESSPLRPLLEQLLSEERQRGGGPRGEPMPVNVYETDDGVVIDAAVPGAGPDDVDIQCAEGVLTIRARSQVPERECLHPVDGVAAAAGVPRTAAFNHLERLVGLRLLESDLRRGLPGKPAKLYRGAGHFDFSHPRRRFAELAPELARALGRLGPRGRLA